MNKVKVDAIRAVVSASSLCERAVLVQLLIFSASTFAASDQDSRLLVHIDVETTGLEVGYHELIDVGVIVTTIDGDIVDRLFLRMMPDHPERLDPGAAAVNGFSVSRWRSLDALEADQGARTLNAFLLKYSTDHQLIFTAFNVGFDQRFIMHFLKSHNLAFNTFFHYMVLDLPSMAWALGAQSLSGDGISAHFGISAEVKDPMLHTGETGAAFNVTLYRAMLGQLSGHHTGLVVQGKDQD